MKRQLVTNKGRSLLYYRLELSEIKDKLPSLIPENKQPVQWVTDHWTAGAYDHAYNSYQFLIGDGYILVSPNIFKWGWHGHCWKRNSYNIGMSYMAMANNNYPVTKTMIKVNALVKSVLKTTLNLNWSQFKDHDYFSKIDGYDSYRWDTQLMFKDAEARALGLRQESLYARGIRYAQESLKQTKQEVEEMTKEPVPEKIFPQLGETPFTDVDPQRYSSDAIIYTHKEGLLLGHKTAEGHKFKPNDPVLREELAVVLKKVHEEKGLTDKISPDTEHPFYDVAKLLHDAGVINAKGKDSQGNPTFGLFKQADYGTVIAAALAVAAKPELLSEVITNIRRLEG